MADVRYPIPDPNDVTYAIMDFDLRDYDEKRYDPLAQRVTDLENSGTKPGTGDLLDFKGVPNRYPTKEECKDTDWITVVRDDGLYFRNPMTGKQIEPKKVSRAESIAAPPPGSDVSHFFHLEDTPHEYLMHAGKFLRVKLDESGIEFVELPTGGGSDVTPEEFRAITVKISRLEDFWGPLVSRTKEFYLNSDSEEDRNAILTESIDSLISTVNLMINTPLKSRIDDSDLIELSNRVKRLEDYWGVDSVVNPYTTVSRPAFEALKVRVERLEKYWGKA